MTDLERRIQSSLEAVRDAYHPGQQRRRPAARGRFIDRYRRRRWVVPLTSLATAALAAVAGIAVVARISPPPERARPAAPAAVVARIPVGDTPVDIGVTPGAVWVANSGDGTVSRIDPVARRQVEAVTLRGAPAEVDYGGGWLWVANSGLAQIVKVDPNTAQVVDEIQVPTAGGQLALSVAEPAVWVVERGRALWRIEMATGRLRMVRKDSPIDVAARDQAVWVLDDEDGLMRLDVNGELQAGPVPQANAPDGDVYAGRAAVWIANRNSQTLLRTDMGALVGVPQIYHLAGRYIDMALSEHGAWVLTRNGGYQLELLDAQTTEQLGRLPLRGRPTEVSTGAGAVWIVDQASNSLLKIDPDRIPG